MKAQHISFRAPEGPPTHPGWWYGRRHGWERIIPLQVVFDIRVDMHIVLWVATAGLHPLVLEEFDWFGEVLQVEASKAGAGEGRAT